MTDACDWMPFITGRDSSVQPRLYVLKRPKRPKRDFKNFNPRIFGTGSTVQLRLSYRDSLYSDKSRGWSLFVTNQTLVTNCLEHCLEAFGCEVKHMWSFLISNPDSFCIAHPVCWWENGPCKLVVDRPTLLASWGPLRKGTWWPWLQFNLPAHLSPCQCQVWKAS